MKKIFNILSITLLLGVFSCQESEFAERYPNPSKISQSTIEKQFSGMLYAANDYYMPKYRNYFVTLRTTLNHYNQVSGWANETGQYIPGSSGTEDVWYNYYYTLMNYRTLEDIYNKSSAEDKASKKIYILAGKVFLYDYTQRVVDLWGSIPFSEAGKIGQNGGDYTKAMAKFDTAESIYTTMLDDLKTISAELNTVNLNAGLQTAFKSQDYINAGNLDSWKRYCNSLRLRMLNRVIDAPNFKSRATAEINEILNAPGTYPVVDNNSQNIFIDVYDVNSEIHSKDLDQTFGGGASAWYLQTAGKKMMDFMTGTNDPRLAYLFEPGANAEGKYLGIDQMGTTTEAADMANNGMVAIYNRSTFQFNQFFPGVLTNAAEVSLIKAEHYLRSGNEAKAKENYENAISQSIDMYYTIQSRSANKDYAGAAPTAAQKAAYLEANGVSWASDTDKLKLIAYQKWVHYNLVQAYENWAENRKLDKLGLQFQVDNASKQTLPPAKWLVPGNEITYNKTNYDAVKADDDLNKKLFWDVK